MMYLLAVLLGIGGAYLLLLLVGIQPVLWVVGLGGFTGAFAVNYLHWWAKRR